MRFIKIIFAILLFSYSCVLLAESGKWVWYGGLEAFGGVDPSPCLPVNAVTKQEAIGCTCANFSHSFSKNNASVDGCSPASERYDQNSKQMLVTLNVAYHTNQNPPVYGLTYGGIKGILLADKPDPCSNPTSSQPVKMSRGEKYYHFTDLYFSGRFPLVWNRSYRVDVRKSLDGKNMSMGQWYFPFLDMHLYLTDSQTAKVILDDGSGTLNFTMSSGVWNSADNGSGVYNTLTDVAGGGWKLVRGNGLTYEFNSNGYVSKVTTQDGLRHILSYTFYNNVPIAFRVTDAASGKFFEVTLADLSKVISVKDSDNRVTEYVWDDDRLNAVIYPDDAVQVFEYDSSFQPQTAPGPVGSSTLITGIYEMNKASYDAWKSSASGTPLPVANRYSHVEYDALGRVTKSELFNGALPTQTQTFSYNWADWNSVTASPVTTITTHDGANSFSTAYTFSAIGGINATRNWQLIAVDGQEGAGSVTGCAATSADTTYENGYIKTTTDSSGSVVTKRTRDSQGRITTLQTGLNSYEAPSAISQKIETSYAGSSTLPESKTYYGYSSNNWVPYRSESFSYDMHKRLSARSKTDLVSNATRSWSYATTYFAGTAVLSAVAVDGPRADVSDVTSYSYNSNGQLASVTDAANHTATYASYNSFGLPGSISDANNITTALSYDVRGRLTSSVTAGAETTISYWSTNGLVKRITLPDGSWLEYNYNSAHQLTRVDNQNGEVIEYTPSLLHGQWVDAVTKNSGATVVMAQRRVFDALGRVWKQKNAAGVVKNIFSYDANNNLQTIVALGDAGDHVTYREFDGQNRIKCSMETAPTAPVTCMGSVESTRYTYDDQGNIKTVTDANNHTTAYTYNGFGELETQVSPDTGTTTYTYDAAGNLATRTKGFGTADAQQILYTWDALNRLTGINYPGADQDVSYIYDQGANGKGRLTRVVDVTGQTDYQYDALGNITLKTETGVVTHVTAYHYSAAGVLQWVQYPGGQTVNVQSAGGQISGLKDNDTAPAFINNITHQPFGGITGWQTESHDLIDQYIRHFDTDGRVSQWGIGASSQSAARMHALQYDAYGNISAVLNLADANQNEAYEYDAQSRLSKVTAEYGRMTYSYDAVGNRLGKLFERKDPATQVWEEFYTEVYGISSTSNQLNSITRKHGTDTLRTRSFGYDSRGNITQDVRQPSGGAANAHWLNYGNSDRLNSIDAP